MTTPTVLTPPMTVLLTDKQAETACLLGSLHDTHGALLLTYEKTAEELGLSVKTVERHVRAGAIRNVRIGGCVRIPITEILRITREGIP